MNNKQNNYVVCDLPKAGLGNMLFPLMKALVFGRINDLPVFVTGYHRIRIGPYIRAEKSKRKYGNSFTFQKNPFGELSDILKLKALRNYDVVNEPSLDKVELNTHKKTIYKYYSIPHWADYFKELRAHRPLVIKIMGEIVRPELRERINKLPSPLIGVHIRMGDFRALRQGEKFNEAGNVRTPEMYFQEVIQSIRNVNGSNLPVTIFTNGFSNEFKTLLTLDRVIMVEGNRDIEDMILLSKSKIIVTSAGSTFGYWAGFLSDAPIVMHPDHIHQPIRQFNFNDLYEGPFDATNGSLVSAIKSIC